jgi:lysozyme family protein
MAEFITSLSLIMELESRVWSISRLDLGKETYAGISRVYWPNNPIWIRIDAIKKTISDRLGRTVTNSEWKEISDELAKDKEVQNMVDLFYEDWWNRMRLTDIKSKKVAFFIFQASVNFGEEKVARWAQQVCVTNGKIVDIDGKIGQQTIGAINSIPEQDYITDIAIIQRYHYLLSIVDRPDQIGNKAGWERRIKMSI